MKSVECAGSVSGADGDRLLEEDAFLCEPVEVRRHGVPVAVRADPVRTGGIQRDDDNVQVAARALDAPVEQPGPGGDKAHHHHDRYRAARDDPGARSYFSFARASRAGLNVGSAWSASLYRRSASARSPFLAAMRPRLKFAGATW